MQYAIIVHVHAEKLTIAYLMYHMRTKQKNSNKKTQDRWLQKSP